MTDTLNTPAAGDPRSENEVFSDHAWRSPMLPWRLLCAAYLAAIVIFFSLMFAEALTWAVYAGAISITHDVGVLADQGVQVLNTLIAPVYIVCACLTLWLTYRLTANAHASGGVDGLPRPFLAAAYYVIPFASLFMPPLVMGRVWRAIVRDESRGPRGLIGTWWALYLIGVLSATFFMRGQPGTAEDLLRVLPVSVLSFFCRGAAAITLLIIFATLVRPRVSVSDTFV